MIFVEILGDQSAILFMRVDRHVRGHAGPWPPFSSLLSAWEAGLQWIAPAVGLLCSPCLGCGQWDAQGTDLAEKRGQGAYVPDSSW